MTNKPAAKKDFVKSGSEERPTCLLISSAVRAAVKSQAEYEHTSMSSSVEKACVAYLKKKE